jgi:hypothetical protein
MSDIATKKVDFDKFWFDLRSGERRLDEFPEDVVTRATELSSLNPDELQAFFDRGVVNEQSSPGIGDVAPGFQLESLDSQGNRTANMVRLSEKLDKPVALVFGSYT